MKYWLMYTNTVCSFFDTKVNTFKQTLKSKLAIGLVKFNQHSPNIQHHHTKIFSGFQTIKSKDVSILVDQVGTLTVHSCQSHLKFKQCTFGQFLKEEQLTFPH